MTKRSQIIEAIKDISETRDENVGIRDPRSNLGRIPRPSIADGASEFVACTRRPPSSAGERNYGKEAETRKQTHCAPLPLLDVRE